MISNYKFTKGNLFFWDGTAYAADETKPYRALFASGQKVGLGDASSVAGLWQSPTVQSFSNGKNVRFSKGNVLIWDQAAYDLDASKPWRPLGANDQGVVLGEPMGDVWNDILQVSALAIEESFMTAWWAFLANYFSYGDLQTLHEDLEQFPEASLSFQVGMRNPTGKAPQHPQPLEGLNIHAQWMTGGKPIQIYGGGATHLIAQSSMQFVFKAKAKAARPDGLNSEALVRQGSDHLFALLNDRTAIFPLAQAGVQNVRPHFPVPVAAEDWSMRTMRCDFRLYVPLRPAATQATKNYRIADGQFQLWDQSAYEADSSKPWRPIGAQGGEIVVGDPC